MKNILSILLVTRLMLTSCSSTSQIQPTKEVSQPKQISPEELMTTFEKLEYFKMTPENELDSLKTELKNSYVKFQYFEGKLYHGSLKYVDHRYYWLDGENLYEDGGLTDYLDEVKSTFVKLGLNLEYANEKVEITDTKLVHTIELNGREYIAYSGEFNNYIWGHAAYNFAHILNKELEIQNSNERVYLISGGNNGRMVFLTEALYEFIISVYPKEEERPMEINQWAKEGGL